MTGEFSPSAEDEVIDAETVYTLRTAISSLTGKQQLVLQLRYGFWDGKCYTQNQVSKTMRISRQAVSRIELRALEKLRNSTVAYQD